MPRSALAAAAAIALAGACAPTSSSPIRTAVPQATAAAAPAGGPAAPAITPVHHAQRVDLHQRLADGRLRAVSRSASALTEGGRAIVRLDDREGNGYGAAWLDDVQLENGTIELEARGQDLPGRSFVGVAFHGVNDSTYDAVYLRPFNFRSADSAARAHAVQYVSHPAHPWKRLREEHPGVFEQPVVPAPDPNDWVRLRVVVEHPVVRVYVNGAAEPALVVRQLGTQRRGRVGLWVGNPSGGDFAGLRVTPSR